MDRPLSPESYRLDRGSEASSIIHLLEHGLHCIRQGHSYEGASYFVLVREQLASDQMYLAPVLEAITQGFTSYWQAQEALLQASKTFARVDTEQQAQLEILASLLPAPVSEVGRMPPDGGGLLHDANDHGNRPLHLPQPTPGDFSSDQFSKQAPLPALYITCFSHFEVRRFGKPVALCSSRNGQAILRYLVVQPGRCATIDTLMALLWPEDEAEVAQRKLHLAISALRRSLNQGYTTEPGGGYIVCKNRVYSFNAAIVIRTDVDEFLHCYHAGQQANKDRVTFYERACRLYTGPFLPDDVYADWSFLQREQLSQTYIAMCKVLADHYLSSKHYEDATKWANAILKENRCHELAHRQLIQIYAAQGRRSEALQQYQRCTSILRQELGVSPGPETTRLIQTILAHEPSSTNIA